MSVNDSINHGGIPRSIIIDRGEVISCPTVYDAVSLLAT
jgi:hypothetical protein